MKIKMITLKGFIQKEFSQIMRDRKMIAAIFFVPIMQLVLFGLALTSEVKNIKFVISGKPCAFSREVEQRAFASGWFSKADSEALRNMDPADIIMSGRAEAVLTVPAEGFDYALERGKPLQLLVNAVNAQRAQQVDGYVKQIIASVAAGRGTELGAGQLIELETRIMYNHYMTTSDFMVPGLLGMASFIVILLVSGMSIAKEKETGTMEKLIASPVSVGDILLGKTVPYFIIGMFIILFMFTVGVLGFNVPFRGYFWQLLLTGMVLCSTALSVSVLLSTIVRTQQQAMMASVLFIMPAILLSGVFFPTENIPSVFRWISYLNPLKYAMVNFRNIFLKGGDMAYFFMNAGLATAMAFVLSLFAFKNFKSTLN